MNTKHSIKDDNSASNEQQQQQDTPSQPQQQPFPSLNIPQTQYNLMNLPPALPNVTNTFSQNRSSSSTTSGSNSSFTVPFNPSYLTAPPEAQITPVEAPQFMDVSRRKSSEDSFASYVQLARRRRSSKSKDKQQQRKSSTVTRPQGRPLSKETRVRLTLVPTLGILYSILVSDTMRKTLKVLQYSNEEDSIYLTNEELSTRNVISGFSSLLNVKVARFSEDGSYTPENNVNSPKFANIDEAVRHLFGLTDYTLIRVSRAAATEVGGSVLLKIETAMPGYSHLNDDEDEDLKTVEENKIYSEAIGTKGDRPSTIFLKKKVARPRYKSDMRIYLIPRINSCAIYCEKRMFKRDLLRGFLDLKKLDRSIIVAFNYEEAIEELKKEGHEKLIDEMGLPTVEEFTYSSHLPKNSASQVSSNGLSISKQSKIQHLQQLQSHQQNNQLQNPQFQFANEYGQQQQQQQQNPPLPFPQPPITQILPQQQPHQQQLGIQNQEPFIPEYYPRQIYDQNQNQQPQHPGYGVPHIPPGINYQPYQQPLQSSPQAFQPHQLVMPPYQGQAQPPPQPDAQPHQNIPFQGSANYSYPQEVPSSNHPTHLEGGYLQHESAGTSQPPMDGRLNNPYQQQPLLIYNNQQPQMYPPPTMGQYYPPQQQDPNNNQSFQ